MTILTTDNEKSELFLRIPVQVTTTTTPESKKELRALGKAMRAAMQKAGGIGIAANQVGASKRLFIAQVPNGENQYDFYLIVNPIITKSSKETGIFEEGCLSIPGVYGDVERSKEVTLQGFTIDGRAVIHRARELVARVFQHEIDHLDGILFTDKAKNIRHERLNKNPKR